MPKQDCADAAAPQKMRQATPTGLDDRSFEALKTITPQKGEKGRTVTC
jgi:hypothetical protein